MQKHFLAYFTFLFLLFLSIPKSFAQCPSDHAQLRDWYLSNNGASWNVNWNTPPQNINDVNMTGWTGITKDANGCVIEINLANKNISGSIPNFKLSNLQVLALWNNKLNGLIPSFNLPNLHELALYNNKLGGSIPNFSLPALRTLYFEFNELTGNIPKFTSHNLEVIHLSNNRLDGVIPDFDLPKLKDLSLQNNLLSGQLPNFNIPNIEVLGLHDNLLTNNIPNFNMPNLRQLYLSNNQLSGIIPNFNMPNLQLLQLQNNKLRGGIPGSLNNLTKLELLWLGRNPRLGGTIPRLDNLTALKYLALEADSLTGNIPDWLGNMTNLMEVGLSSNKLSGEIPINIGNLKKLKILWLGSNQLAGVIPATLGGLDSLELLTLDNNQFKGSLPESMKNLNNLWHFYISKNKFSNILQNATLKIGQGRRSYISTLPTPRFVIDQNALTFSNILPYINKGFEFLYNPQDSIYKDTIINARVGEPFTIDLNIDNSLTTNSYQWFKNDTLFKTPTNSNKLVFDKLLPTDAGVYTCQVTNSLAGALTLYSRKITVVASPNTSCRYRDSLALSAFYNATNGQNWRVAARWDTTKKITEWYGVITNNEGCVTAIDFEGLVADGTWTNVPTGDNLNGSITPRIGDLKDLEVLVITNNPNLIGKIPTEISQLNKLRILVLDNNKIYGSIPNSIAKLRNLEWLFLQNNALTGTVPSEIGDSLNRLKHLGFAQNRDLGGTLPSSLGKLSNLISLNLYTCSFEGAVPSELAQLTNLEYLTLNDNKLNSIPSSFSNFRKLKQLHLQDNLFSTLPNLSNILPTIVRDTLINGTGYYWGFRLFKNKLTFKDILPYLPIVNYPLLPNDYSRYAPQDSIYKDTTIEVQVGEPFTIDLNIDNSLTTNNYQWFKNGVTFQSPTNSNKLGFNNLTFNDNGFYTCQVTNSKAKDLTLYSRKIKLRVVDAASCAYKDSLQLVMLYKSTNGQNWTKKWDLDNTMKSWYGIGLNNNGCVTTIVLKDNKLTGTIPDINLSNLKSIDLSSNQLNGCFPIELMRWCNIDCNFQNNPKLPWQGDFTPFCMKKTQIDAPCSNGNPETVDLIDKDCNCVGVDKNNCVSLLSDKIFNFITPNHDNLNPYFNPLGDLNDINCLVDSIYAELRIFNASGDMIFFAKPYHKWYATRNNEPDGEAVPPGTYYFQFSVNPLNGKPVHAKGRLLVYDKQ